MPALTYPLIQFGSVYATSNNASDGTRYICEVEGLEALQLTDNIGSIRALDGTIYLQTTAIKDNLIVVRFPLIDTTKYGAIETVIQTAITGATTFTLNINSDAGNYTFTAKPAENPIQFQLSTISGHLSNVEFRQYCTD